jgi:hypothetical protein
LLLKISNYKYCFAQDSRIFFYSVSESKSADIFKKKLGGNFIKRKSDMCPHAVGQVVETQIKIIFTSYKKTVHFSVDDVFDIIFYQK